MREILSRGKRKDNGEWVEGFIIFADDKAFILNTARVEYIAGYNENRLNFVLYEVIPETVGQYTGGLKDKNGTKIFEGDIVSCTDNNNQLNFTAVVEFGNPNCTYDWGYQLKHIQGDKPNMDILLWVEVEETGAICEVIGNIHDNPELLEAEK